jgi:hypothetical protein
MTLYIQGTQQLLRQRENRKHGNQEESKKGRKEKEVS